MADEEEMLAGTSIPGTQLRALRITLSALSIMLEALRLIHVFCLQACG